MANTVALPQAKQVQNEMSAAIRLTEERTGTRLLEVRRAFNNMVRSSGATPNGGACENNDALAMDAFKVGEPVVRLLIPKPDGTMDEWCLSKDLVKHYCSKANVKTPPYCEWVGAHDDSGHGGGCGDLKLLQIPSRGGETWMITKELGTKLLEAANLPSSHEVRVERLKQVSVGATHNQAGGASTSHGNTKHWVWGYVAPPATDEAKTGESKDSGESKSGDELCRDHVFFTMHVENEITSVAFSPDGKQVASGFGDDTVRLWDVESGAELRTFEGHGDFVTSVAFSPTGKQVVSGSGDKTVRLWDVESGVQLRKFEGHTSSVLSVAFSPDGKQVVSGSWDNTVRLWDVENGAGLRKFEGHTDFIKSVAFSPDGKQVVSGSSDKTVRLWDVKSGVELRKFKGHTRVNAVAFSGKQVVSGYVDSAMRRWDVESGAELRKFEGHTSSVLSVAFSPDGKQVVSGSADKTVRLWDVESGAELRKSEGYTRNVFFVAFSGKQVVSGSYDKTVRLWCLDQF